MCIRDSINALLVSKYAKKCANYENTSTVGGARSANLVQSDSTSAQASAQVPINKTLEHIMKKFISKDIAGHAFVQQTDKSKSEELFVVSDGKKIATMTIYPKPTIVEPTAFRLPIKTKMGVTKMNALKNLSLSMKIQPNFGNLSNMQELQHIQQKLTQLNKNQVCLLYTSPSPRDRQKYRMPSSA